MAHQEYMLIPLYMIPHEMIQEYDLMPLAHAGKVLEQINWDMYGLPQADCIAYDTLKIHLAKGGYVPTGRTPDLFKHDTCPIYFCLVVDDFGVK